MCTILTAAGQPLVGRTMDFPPRTPWRPTYLPVNYRWRPANGDADITNHHAIIGGMRVADGHYLIGDGVNDQGLFCAELFFPVAADYGGRQTDGQLLTPQDFIMWVLGKHTTVAAVIADLARITVNDDPWFDGQYYPFHWLLVDSTGAYTIEPLAGRLVVSKNKVGVLTNTPAYPLQLNKLNAYLGYDNLSFAQRIARLTAKITGTNSLQRFQRAAIARWQERPTTSDQLFTILDRLAVPKNPQHAHNYTHYETVVDYSKKQYQFYDCRTTEVTVCCLPELMQTLDAPTRF